MTAHNSSVGTGVNDRACAVIDRAYSERLRLSLNPDFPIFEKFLLPDGNDLLEFVDGVLAGRERCTTVGGSNNDRNAGLSNFEAAKSVHDSNGIDLPRLANKHPDFFHLGERHCLVS